jgi:hypothetical protein
MKLTTSGIITIIIRTHYPCASTTAQIKNITKIKHRTRSITSILIETIGTSDRTQKIGINISIPHIY